MPTETPDLRSSATSTTAFFAIALGFTWLLQLPGLLAARGVIDAKVESLLPLAALGAFGPLVSALICSRGAPGGILGLFRRVTIWRVGAGWYLIALFGLGAVYVVARAVFGAGGGSGAAWLYPPQNAQHIAALVMMPVVEEFGWRGFALPRLLARHRPLVATTLLGVFWSLWHLMMFLFATTSAPLLAVSFLNIVAGSFAFTWLFLRTRGSLLLAILLHAGAHLNNPAHAVGSSVPMAIYTAGLVVVAGLTVLLDRRTWASEGPISAIGLGAAGARR
jgi:membrane protease YdiL (CAAX protease family)